ncbi:hypothetical protein QFC21_006592 [Naganishia friedmannii]|uniref:Uncharacterized protein n=1 Tax=Naganishia friedmannii TaxID=89922 RepID=A0ACC2V108_9TREE|nr:hypothetical protein QFC21_006592 [Naganishia friedmannii]
MNTGFSSSSSLPFSDDEVVYLGGLNDQLSAYYRKQKELGRFSAQRQIQSDGQNHEQAPDDHQYMQRDSQDNDIPILDHSRTSTNTHSMITRQNARENAVTEDDNVSFDMAYSPDVIRNTLTFSHSDGNLTPDWVAALAGQNSPPIVVSELEDIHMEEDMIINNIRIEAIQSLQPNNLDQPFQPIRYVHPGQPLNPVLPAILPLPANEVIAHIVVRKAAAEKKELVQRFREEV